MDVWSIWLTLRPYVYSAIRHGVVTGAVYITAKTGVQLDDGMVNGVAGAALSGVDTLVASGAGALGGVLTNALKAQGFVGSMIAGLFQRR